MNKTNTDSLTPYQRAAIEWFKNHPDIVELCANFIEHSSPAGRTRKKCPTCGTGRQRIDTIDRWLIRNVPHYAEVFCRALKIPVGSRICRITNCGQPVENPNLDICNRCLEEITVGDDDRDAVLRKAIEGHEQENLYDEREDR